jgi:hypothetical protein
MFEITVKRWNGVDWRTAKMQTPFLPRVGDYIDYEPCPVTGYVRDVSFWWDKDAKLEIVVAIK